MRLLADLFLLLAIFFFPWWLVLLAASALFFVFPRFYELLFVGLLSDLLYGLPLERFGGFEFVQTAGCAALFLALTLVKDRMRV